MNSSSVKENKPKLRRTELAVIGATAAAFVGLVILLASRSTSIQIPECKQSPWKKNEDLVGTCPGDINKVVETAKTVAECAEACCSSSECIAWQFRRDKGCRHGGDVRLGMEKDGVSAWCAATPPAKWQGQYLVLKETKENVRDTACSTKTWNPHEQPGQCFGLGDRKSDEASKSAQNCMEACCADDSCGAWQWEASLGCFYGKGMHSCQKADDPIVFEPFVGRRKYQSTRKYIDNEGKPWQQSMI